MLGIALSITADLGVGSWQVFETGLVETTGAGFGTVVFFEALVALALAWFWLGERPWIATAILAGGGVGIGALLGVLSTPASLWARTLLLAAGISLLAVGVAFYLASDLGASAQDALFVGFYRKYGVRPAVVRFALDATLVGAGFALGGQLGAGTVAVTLLVPALIEPTRCVGAGGHSTTINRTMTAMIRAMMAIERVSMAPYVPHLREVEHRRVVPSHRDRHTRPIASMARATFRKPAMFAPIT